MAKVDSGDIFESQKGKCVEIFVEPESIGEDWWRNKLIVGDFLNDFKTWTTHYQIFLKKEMYIQGITTESPVLWRSPEVQIVSSMS